MQTTLFSLNLLFISNETFLTYQTEMYNVCAHYTFAITFGFFFLKKIGANINVRVENPVELDPS